MDKGYDVWKDPKTQQFWVIGYLSGRQWMRIRGPYKTSTEAWDGLKRQRQADASMKAEIRAEFGGPARRKPLRKAKPRLTR